MLVMNQDPAERGDLVANYLESHVQINDFLLQYDSGDGTPWLFDTFGWSEAVFTPFFQRFWFVDYYEDGIDLPRNDARYDPVREWRDACMHHPKAQQVCREEVIKIYYDYSLGKGNGALPQGRKVSSFAFEPHWKDRPMPPKKSYEGGTAAAATDEELGLM